MEVPADHFSFNWCAGLGAVALLLYYGDERSVLHRGAMENIFWFCTNAWLAFVLFLLPTSPLVQLRLLITVGGADSVALVLLAGLAGVKTHARRRSVRLASSLQRCNLQELAKLQPETVAARIATSRLANILNAKQGISWFYRRTRSKQDMIVEALRGCLSDGPEHLLYVLNCWDVDLPHLFSVVRSPDFLSLLGDLAPEMDIVTKARLVDAVQRQSDFFFERRLQEFVVELFCQTRGEELTTLKNLLDESGDFYNLHKLVFSDLPEDLREDVLAHIEQEGTQVRAANTGLLRKVLSDIDDTLFCSGGHFPAGADKRFPKGQLYPGVLALLRELGRQRPMAPSTSGGGAVPAAAGQPEANLRGGGDSGSPSRGGSGTPGGGGASGKLSRRRRLSAALFANLAQVARPFATQLGTDSPAQASTDTIWLRVSAGSWVEASVPATETVAELRARLGEARGPGSGGGSPAVGADTSYGAEGLADISFSPPTRRAMSNLVFLTARPHAYKDYVESKSYQMFWRLRARGMLHCMPTLLPGRIRSSAGAALRGALLQFRTALGVPLLVLLVGTLIVHRSATNAQVWICILLFAGYVYLSITTHRRHKCATSVWGPVGEDKRSTFLEYWRLYSECDVVFFGDNGQGDLLCAEKLAEGAPEGRGRIFSFVHEVVPREEMLTCLSPVLSDQGRERIWRDKDIFFHKTYVGAAINACRCGVISHEGLARVARSAVEDMVRICTAGPALDGAHQVNHSEYVQELNEDVSAVNKMLPESLPQVDSVPSSFGSKTPQFELRSSPSVLNFSFSTLPPVPEPK